jgi:hypothetical protein
MSAGQQSLYCCVYRIRKRNIFFREGWTGQISLRSFANFDFARIGICGSNPRIGWAAHPSASLGACGLVMRHRMLNIAGKTRGPDNHPGLGCLSA